MTYFIFFPRFEIYWTITPIVFKVKAKTPHPSNIAKIAYQVSETAIGVISPYPTVSTVVTDQYRDRAYFSLSSASNRF